MAQKLGEERAAHLAWAGCGGAGVINEIGARGGFVEALAEEEHHVEGAFGAGLAEEEEVTGLGGLEAGGEEGAVVAHEIGGVGEVARAGVFDTEERGDAGGRFGERRRGGEAPTVEPCGVVLAEGFAVGEAGERRAVFDFGGALGRREVIDGFGEPAEPAAERAGGGTGEAGSGAGQQKEPLSPSHRSLYDTAVYLFVYGSLKRGQGPLAEMLWAKAEFAGRATMEGRLYTVGLYAGVVEGEGLVHGELARLQEPEETLSALDQYEGDEYVRVRRAARLETGEAVEAMVYWYRGSLEGAVWIEPGWWERG